MNATLQMLNQAIESGRDGVISVRDGGTTHQIRVRFAGTANGDGQGPFWGQVLGGDHKLLDWLVRAQATVEVSFNTDQASIFFDSALLEKRKQWFSQRVLLKRPEQVTVVERRKDNRETLPRDIEVAARIVRPQQTSGPACDLAARVWDVSPTGASFLCRADQPLPKLEAGEPLDITLIFDGAEHRIVAAHRYTQRLSSSTVRLGVQFNGDAAHDPTTNARLQQLLQDLQSLRLRRRFRHTLRKTFSFNRD